jgi:hypothetical protein
MLYVKIMSDCDMSDTHPDHCFKLVPVANNEVMAFVPILVPDGQVGNHFGHRFQLEVASSDGKVRSHEVTGNAYVMNEHGKTIASHGC